MINFIKFRRFCFAFSAILLLVSISSLILWGLKPSIDFTGGALYEFTIANKEEDVGTEKIRNSLSSIEQANISSIQYSKDNKSYILKLNDINEEKKNELKAKLSTDFESEIKDLRFETVGPILGKELLIRTAIAILIASCLIMGYVAYQFKDKVYGISAILAMFHDSIILCGAFSLLGKFYETEVDTLFVTALLTTLSFSVHDTIVVFDRIRESLKKNTGLAFDQMVNLAIQDTMPRSLNNSLTIIFMLVCLVLFGGATIKWFAVALLIGTVTGTYSSPFVAAPLMYVFHKTDFSKFKIWRKKKS